MEHVSDGAATRRKWVGSASRSRPGGSTKCGLFTVSCGGTAGASWMRGPPRPGKTASAGLSWMAVARAAAVQLTGSMDLRSVGTGVSGGNGKRASGRGDALRAAGEGDSSRGHRQRGERDGRARSLRAPRSSEAGNELNLMAGSGMQQARGGRRGASRRGAEEARGRNGKSADGDADPNAGPVRRVRGEWTRRSRDGGEATGPGESRERQEQGSSERAKCSGCRASALKARQRSGGLWRRLVRRASEAEAHEGRRR